jgi:hypothetical protein
MVTGRVCRSTCHAWTTPAAIFAEIEARRNLDGGHLHLEIAIVVIPSQSVAEARRR